MDHFRLVPELSLVDARRKFSEARRQVMDGTDPVQVRSQARRQSADASANTFRQVATEWHALKAKSWSPACAKKDLHRLEIDIFPDLGNTAVAHRDIINALRKIESRGAHEIAKRDKAVCGQIFSYAIQVGATTRNPVADLKDVLQSVSPGNFPEISSDALPAFLQALQGYEACMQPATRIGLRLLMLTFVRTSELIETPWTEIA